VGGVPTAGEALIENNEVHNNSLHANRGGISVRDAQDATIRNNHFGAATIGGVAYLPNSHDVAITASDSGRSDRPNLSSIRVVNNALDGETVKGCELPNTVVACAGDTRWCANIVDRVYELLRTYLPLTRVNRLGVRLVRTPHRTPATRSPSRTSDC
jgi:parallel beta-helix repeat protein